SSAAGPCFLLVWPASSSQRRPMNRLIEYTVLAGLVTACRLASRPTRRSPVLVKATTDGTVRPPSADGMTVGSPPSMTATTEFVVPRSMPMILLMSVDPSGIRVVWGVAGRGWGDVLGDLDEGGAKDAVADAVAA